MELGVHEQFSEDSTPTKRAMRNVYQDVMLEEKAEVNRRDCEARSGRGFLHNE